MASSFLLFYFYFVIFISLFFIFSILFIHSIPTFLFYSQFYIVLSCSDRVGFIPLETGIVGYRSSDVTVKTGIVGERSTVISLWYHCDVPDIYRNEHRAWVLKIDRISYNTNNLFLIFLILIFWMSQIVKIYLFETRNYFFLPNFSGIREAGWSEVIRYNCNESGYVTVI